MSSGAALVSDTSTFLKALLPQSFGARAGALGAHVASLTELQGKSKSSSSLVAGKFVIVGIPDDRGVTANKGHAGASAGPESFRTSFYKLNNTTLRVARTASHPGTSLADFFIDAGDIVLAPDIAETHLRLAFVVESFLRQNAAAVFVIGGGHDFSYGSFAGHAAAVAGLIPIVNIDAHFDLRPVENDLINSGTPFYRIIESLGDRVALGKALLELGIQRERNSQALYDYALEKGVGVVEYEALTRSWQNVQTGKQNSPMDHVLDHLETCSKLGWPGRTGPLHLSVDLDAYAASLAPGTSASTPFGCQLDELGPVIDFFARSAQCRCIDIAELCPSRDVLDQTARLAAGLVYKMALLRLEYMEP